MPATQASARADARLYLMRLLREPIMTQREPREPIVRGVDDDRGMKKETGRWIS
jgi:hypothetical protein